MKVQFNQQQNNHPKFGSGLDTTLRYLATNQAVGANGVDFCFMVSPRTASDMIKRGPAAGMETLRREIMGTINDSLIGCYGMAAGALLAFSMKKYGVSVGELFTAPETLNILAENKADQLKNNKTQLDYIKTTLGNIKGYNPTAQGADNEGFVKLSQETIDETAQILDNALNNKMTYKDWSKGRMTREVLMNKITESTGAQSKYILESLDKKQKSVTDLKIFLNDMFLVSNSFNKDKVKTAFEKQVKSGKSVKGNAFINSLSKFMKNRALLGFAMAAAVGISVQPINMYLTKLKTGSDGFVGVEGRTKDNSAKFKAIKAASSAGFFGMILATLKASPLKFMDKMAFKGGWPTIDQLKGVYGVTIISRIFSARDKDELREVLTKDTLGFLSWLVLGDIVNKLTADTFNKSTLNYKAGEKSKNPFVRTFRASLKTRDEILIETLAKNNISTTVQKDGKTTAKTFKEMLKDLDKLQPEVKKMTRNRLHVLNAAQCAGYLFSGLVLGLGIPNLNIYITNKLDKKRKAEALKKQQFQNVTTA